jgi:hypothetical protein
MRAAVTRPARVPEWEQDEEPIVGSMRRELDTGYRDEIPDTGTQLVF